MTAANVAWAALALVLLSACSSGAASQLPAATASHDEASPTPRAAASLSQEWQIRFFVSGGFAGRSRTLQVNNKGQLTAEDAVSQTQVKAQLPADDLNGLGALVASLQPPNVADHLSRCADCFNYDVAVSSGDRLLKFQGDDTTLQGSGWQELVGRLMTLQQDALTGKFK